LGEFSSLVVNGTLTFEDALQLVSIRASAMQKACEANPSSMAAVLALDDAKAEEICKSIVEDTGEMVVPANYNCPGQLVISGTNNGIDIACERMKSAGAKRALKLPVESAKEELSAAIQKTTFHRPVCPVYQNVVAKAVIDPDQIKQNLIDQLTGPVRWTQSVESMIKDGATKFTEVGPGKVLQGLIAKINKTVEVESFS
jgi:[acyl-carrier-protein] S-malonyltransferase